MDSRIALGIQPLQIPDQAAGLQRALTLKALMGQNELQGLQTQEAQRTLRQNQAMDEAALGSTSTADYLMRLSKINPGAAIKLQGDWIGAQEAKGKLTKQQWELTGHLAGSVLNTSPDKQPEVYAQARQTAIQAGLPGAEQLPEQFTPELIPHLNATLHRAMSAKDAAESASYLAGKTAQQPITPADYRNEAARLDALGNKVDSQRAKEYRDEAARLETHQQTISHQKTMEQQGAEHIQQGWLQTDPFGTLRSAATKNLSASPQDGSSAAQANGPEYLTTLPKALGDQVKALAEGRLAFPAGFALKSPYWQNMLQMVSQYDPTFDAINFNARVGTRKDFTSGTSAKNITALNTVIGHLDTFSKAADSLNNTSLPAYNSIANWMSSNSGDPRVKQFENTRKAVADELTRVWRGTGGAEADIQAWLNTMSAAGSPAQLHGVIKNIGDLLESRLSAIQDQYKRGMGTTEQPLQFLTPEARSTLDRLEQKASGAATQPASTTGSPQGTPLPKAGTGSIKNMQPTVLQKGQSFTTNSGTQGTAKGGEVMSVEDGKNYVFPDRASYEAWQRVKGGQGAKP